VVFDLSWESLSARHSIPQLHCQKITDGTGSRFLKLDLVIVLGFGSGEHNLRLPVLFSACTGRTP